ncbi:hypothetical protein QJT07_01690 [Treponema pallidum]|nr:hypothetical protein [Treponema pallidum]UNO84470.1 hypothetical protein KEB21_05210 [Treponema pallidum]UNO85733.1 hypothetical protein KEB09_05215 [Treponema pallidum]UNQ69580.1 hypothetical protein KD985_05215 [Treponema pallidum]UNQ71495.1 hypothetical protein KEA26_05215 [Treponema pallidum]WBF88605.1 hypothetical protein KEB12_05270 [Treponema pallidum]
MTRVRSLCLAYARCVRLGVFRCISLRGWAPYRAVETVLVQSALTSVERLHEMFRVY